jgi:hypothetical protein
MLAAVVLVLLALPVFAVWYLFCDWVPPWTIKRLPGATKAEVRELLGEPDSGDEEGACEWKYRRPYHVAEFQIEFGEDGRVSEWAYDR